MWIIKIMGYGVDKRRDSSDKGRHAYNNSDDRSQDQRGSMKYYKGRVHGTSSRFNMGSEKSQS